MPIAAGRLAVRIDPGDCFGSGSHPSTQMVLAALAERPPDRHDHVLDVGCGSGILSVAAALLGALRVTAIDIDPAAVRVTRRNAAANGVASSVRTRTTPIGNLPGRFDLALVNVTAAVHATEGPSIVAQAAPDARILVAGLLQGQWRHVQRAYDGVTIEAQLALDGWEGYELRAAQAKDR